MNKNDAINAGFKELFFHVSLKNHDGTAMRCRKNGQCKVWKTRPNAFKLPVKHGLNTFFYITEENAHEWE